MIYPGISWDDNRFIADLKRWKTICNMSDFSDFMTFAVLMSEKKEFRNLFIYRNRKRPLFRRIVSVLYRPLQSLFIEAGEIGGGLFIQHGFATMIAAESIGENCWINQQVTVGYRGTSMRPPVIKDNVMITCGAKVLGDIVVGNNAVIGANAVVIHDVADNATMVGVPAKRIK